MENKYVSFVPDEHLIDCIANLHAAYTKSKNNLTKQDFYKKKQGGHYKVDI